MKTFDAVILGAGGAGLMCAAQAAKRGRRVAVIDHAAKVGGKILISGGGRCNFTNTGASPANYVSKNEHFARSAMSRYTPEDFIRLVQDHGIAYHEKKLGQLFCDVSAKEIVDLLVKECEKAGVTIFTGQRVVGVARGGPAFVVKTDKDTFQCRSLVIATGGLSIPKLGATGFGYDVAKQFGLNVVKTAPALDGFVFGQKDREAMTGFAGISFEAAMTCNGVTFKEGLLFTHSGFSGPAALQVSLYWNKADAVHVDFVPQMSQDELTAWFEGKKNSKLQPNTLLGELVPKRLADRLWELYLPGVKGLGNLSKKDLEAFVGKLKDWSFVPNETVGYARAEVTRGGVDTDELSSKTMEANKVKGLYFIGEVVDVTGWLGGYNFQWAWASGWAAGQVI